MRRVCGLAIFAVGLAACGGASAPSPSTTPAAQPAPALVQVENLPAARPQSGLGEADVVYEYVTEGGISRFSAIFLHPPSVQVGPIRSARLVTIRLTQHYGAVLVYSGASTYVEQQIGQADIVYFNETKANGDLFRTGDRVPPHNLYTNGAHLTDLLTHANAPLHTWQLWARTAHAPASGKAVASFQFPISDSETPVWTFNTARGDYTRREPATGAFIDSDTGQPVAAATVIVQQVVITVAPEVEDVSGAHGVELNIDSGGAAQVFTGGREYDATWSQPANGPPSFLLADGKPAPIAPGPVWIELVPRGSTAQPL
jgi:Protein of unknown function (DUF3048) N-terminal domain/Protein of unknown function (DUF3048) C-terminal domain